MEIGSDDDSSCEEIEIIKNPEEIVDLTAMSSSESNFCLNFSESESDEVSCKIQASVLKPNVKIGEAELLEESGIEVDKSWDESQNEYTQEEETDQELMISQTTRSEVLTVYALTSDGEIVKASLSNDHDSVNSTVCETNEHIATGDVPDDDDEDSDYSIAKSSYRRRRTMSIVSSSSDSSDFEATGHVPDDDDEDSDCSIAKSSYRRRRTMSIMSSSSDSSNFEEAKKTKRDNNVRKLKKELKSLEYKTTKKNSDYLCEFKRNPKQILKELESLKREGISGKDLKDKIEVYQDKLNLSEEAIISFQERTTRSKIRNKKKILEREQRKTLFEEFSIKKHKSNC